MKIEIAKNVLIRIKYYCLFSNYPIHCIGMKKKNF